MELNKQSTTLGVNSNKLISRTILQNTKRKTVKAIQIHNTFFNSWKKYFAHGKTSSLKNSKRFSHQN